MSWLRLCPRTAISGGKPLHKRKRKGQGAQRVAAVLRMAATTLARSKSALGAYYRRTSRLKDAATAVLATARKLACFVYRMLRHGQEYVDVGEKAFELAAATRRLKALHASARALGYDLVPTTTQPTAEAAG